MCGSRCFKIEEDHPSTSKDAGECLPHGQSLVPALFEASSLPIVVHVLQLALTTGLLLFLPFSVSVYAKFWGLDNTWDTQHKVNYSMAGLANSLVSVGIESWRECLIITIAAFLILLIADIVGVKWPKNLEVSGCYFEMFCEPCRESRLVRHLGNTYSNVFYLFGGLCVVVSASQGTDLTPFWLSDALFGVCLVTLSFASIGWHSCSYSKFQYVDLILMDACIFYLIVRLAFMIAFFSMQGHAWVGMVPWSCAAFYVLVIYLIMLGRPSLKYLWGIGPYDQKCPFSGRSQLSKKAITMTDGVLFLLAPVLYTCIVPPMACYLMGTTGSYIALSLTKTSLMICWVIRMFERFLFDGYLPMNVILGKSTFKKNDDNGKLNSDDTYAYSTAQFWGAAIVSPTAVLHWCTSVTLIAGFVWVRSLDQCMEW